MTGTYKVLPGDIKLAYFKKSLKMTRWLLSKPIYYVDEFPELKRSGQLEALNTVVTKLKNFYLKYVHLSNKL